MNAGQWSNWCNAISSKQHYIHQDVQNIQETLDVTFKKQQRRMLRLNNRFNNRIGDSKWHIIVLQSDVGSRYGIKYIAQRTNASR